MNVVSSRHDSEIIGGQIKQDGSVLETSPHKLGFESLPGALADAPYLNSGVLMAYDPSAGFKRGSRSWMDAPRFVRTGPVYHCVSASVRVQENDG